MRDENTMPGLITGYAEANQSGEVKLQLLEQNREAVERKLAEIERSLDALEQRWADREITLPDLERHRKEAAAQRTRLQNSLQLLALYVARLERMRD